MTGGGGRGYKVTNFWIMSFVNSPSCHDTEDNHINVKF